MPTQILEKISSGKDTGTSQSSQSLQALAIAQAAKVDRKLYIGNLPNGITPSTVILILNIISLT